MKPSENEKHAANLRAVLVSGRDEFGHYVDPKTAEYAVECMQLRKAFGKAINAMKKKGCPRLNMPHHRQEIGQRILLNELMTYMMGTSKAAPYLLQTTAQGEATQAEEESPW